MQSIEKTSLLMCWKLWNKITGNFGSWVDYLLSSIGIQSFSSMIEELSSRYDVCKYSCHLILFSWRHFECIGNCNSYLPSCVGVYSVMKTLTWPVKLTVNGIVNSILLILFSAIVSVALTCTHSLGVIGSFNNCSLLKSF